MIVFLAAGLAFVVAAWAKIDPRIPISGGLASLAATGILLSLEKQELANLFATIAFFLFVFGTLLGFVELLKVSFRRGRARNGRPMRKRQG